MIIEIECGIVSSTSKTHAHNWKGYNMKIEELNGQYAKIGKSSITVKDECGKTRGIITQCYELTSRESSEIWGKVRKAVGLDATSCIAKMRRVAGKIVYLENINNHDSNAEKLSQSGIMVAKYRRLA